MIEKYKELIRQLDEIQRKGGKVNEEMHDEFEDLWDNLTEKEREEAKNYSIQLYESWSDLEKYLEAVEVLENFPEPSLNDKTTPKARKLQKDYWIEIRDKAYANLSEKEKNILHERFGF